MGTACQGSASEVHGIMRTTRSAAPEISAAAEASRASRQAPHAPQEAVHGAAGDRAPAGQDGEKPTASPDCEPARTGYELESAVDDALHEVTVYWSSLQHELAPQAGEQFVSFVNPACLYGEEPMLSHEIIGTMFTEWLLFDYLLPNGMTPIEAYANEPPIEASHDTLRIVRSIARTQFFSRFAILYKDVAVSIATLRDIQTGRRYDVFDPRLCQTERWRAGTVGERLVRVGEMWIPVAPIRLYDRAAPGKTSLNGPGYLYPKDIRRKPEAEHASLYLRLLRDVIGIDGRYRHTATMSTSLDSHHNAR